MITSVGQKIGSNGDERRGVSLDLWRGARDGVKLEQYRGRAFFVFPVSFKAGRRNALRGGGDTIEVSSAPKTPPSPRWPTFT